MAVNKVEYDGNTLIDLTGDTATAANVLNNKTFHLKSGEAATGTMTNNGAVTATITEPNGVYPIPKGYHNGNGTVTATYEKGYQVATGTYTGTTSTKSFTVSGLGFKPVGVTVAALAGVGDNFQNVMLASSSVTVTNPSTGSSVYSLRVTLTKSGTNKIASFALLTGNPITFNNDGFTVSRSSDYYSGIYSYVCWG